MEAELIVHCHHYGVFQIATTKNGEILSVEEFEFTGDSQELAEMKIQEHALMSLEELDAFCENEPIFYEEMSEKLFNKAAKEFTRINPNCGVTKNDCIKGKRQIIVKADDIDSLNMDRQF
jgi:hypothetical protein